MMRYEGPLLEVENLSISFGEGDSIKSALIGVSFQLERGKTLGIVGESGSGKSLTSLAIMGLLPLGAHVDTGVVRFTPDPAKSLEILGADPSEIMKIRGKRVAMIFQEPMTSLNPVHTCGAQVAESLIHHLRLSKSEARKRAIALFAEVELPNPDEIFDRYPHQISGGQKQRVMIAMAMCCEPDIIIADEPTTALDVTVQKRILELLNKLRKKNNMGLIFITHDLGVVAEIADDVLVMYRGKVLETASVGTLFKSPKDPYTKALIACRPRLDSKPYRLPTVADFLGTNGLPTAHSAKTRLSESKTITEALLRVEGLNVWFPTAKDWKGKPTAYFQAVRDMKFDVRKGETLGLVGESGCGKSTLGRALLRLIPSHSGQVYFKDIELTSLNAKEMRPHRKSMQLIFQDPYASLNPRMTVAQTLLEPLIVHGLSGSSAERNNRIEKILDRVGLVKGSLQKYPHEFSGGQRQRICIARALMVEPEFIVCDESVSALDVSVQAQVLNLLNELKDDFGLTYIFISHDLSVVKYMSDRMIVMRKGQIEEMGQVQEVYASPKSAYTRELIDAIPVLA